VARQNAPDSNELLFLLALAATEATAFDADAAATVAAAWHEIEAMAAKLGELDHDTGWLVSAAALWQRQLSGPRPDVGGALRAATAEHGLAVPYARLSCLAAAAFIAAVQSDAVAGAICDDYLDAFCRPDWDHGADQDLAQIVVVLAACGRRADIARIMQLVPIRGAWLEVIAALAAGRDDEAVAALERMHCGGLAAMSPAALRGAPGAVTV
jgi:hypothetical protein